MKYGAVIVIFLLSGAGLKTAVLLQSLRQWRLHLATQTLSLVAIPAIGYGLAQALGRTPLNKDLVAGVAVCLATSTTASTNVVFTKAAGGAEGLALVNAVLGSLVGIFLTPAWLTTYLAATGHVPYAAVIQQLVITVVAPLLVGNLLQYTQPRRVAWLAARVNFNKAGSFCILLLVWATFSNTFAKQLDVTAGSVLAVAALMGGCYVAFTAGALLLPLWPPLGRLLRASDADAIALSMCVGTKSVALGIPIITAVYAHNPAVGLLSLPLIIYHALQILMGSLITAPLKRWVGRRTGEAAARVELAALDERKADEEAAGEGKRDEA